MALADPAKNRKASGLRNLKLKMEAADKVASGEPLCKVAQEAGVSETTMRKWLGEPQVVERYRDKLNKEGFSHYGKAMAVLIAQLEDKSPWIRQGAARELLNRLGDAVTGVDSREVIIRLEGAPEIGLPTGVATDDATDYIEAKDAYIT